MKKNSNQHQTHRKQAQASRKRPGHRRWTESQKRDAVALMLARGDRKVEEIAEEIGVRSSLLYRWRQLYGTEGVGEPQAEALDQEVVRLRRELSLVTKERDFLKNVSAFFAKETQ